MFKRTLLFQYVMFLAVLLITNMPAAKTFLANISDRNQNLEIITTNINDSFINKGIFTL